MYTSSNISKYEEENEINRQQAIKTCKANGIKHYVFWDSKKPINNQEDDLKSKLKNLSPLKIDKIEELNKLVKEEKIRLSNADRELETYWDEIPYDGQESYQGTKEETKYWEWNLLLLLF